MKKRGIVAAFAVAALTLSACGGSGDGGDTNGGGSASGTPTEVKPADYLHAEYDELKQGGTLTLPINEISEQQNPFHQDGTGYTSNLWYWYNPQFALYDDEGTWSFNPDYFDDVTAEEVDGNTVVTYKIKEEAVYNDGTPIDYRTFETTWLASNGESEGYLPSSTDGYERIASVEPGESDKEAVVTFDGIYAWWEGLFNLGLNPAVDSADAFENLYRNAVQPDLGAGPYKVDNFDVGAGTVSFVPNENWWGDPGKLDKVTYRQMEASASLNAFLNGEIDSVDTRTSERLTAVQGMEGINIYTAMSPSNALLMLNSGNDILSDINVREAVFSAIDRSVLADITFQGLDYSEPLPGSFILFPTQEGYNDNLSEALTYDPEHAKEILDEAGWTAASDGAVREKDGEQLSIRFVLIGDDPAPKNRAVAMQQSLAEVGIELTIDERPSSDFSKVYTEKDFDVFAMAFSSTDPFGVAYFDQIYGSDSGLNFSGTGTEEFDKKIADLAKIGDADEQIAAANELEVEAFELYGIMPLYNGPGIRAEKEGLANFGGDTGNQSSIGFSVRPKQEIGWVE
ncbi:ABC transporter family substrate-binding protein [Actinomycetaceae bacterium L2_0104]